MISMISITNSGFRRREREIMGGKFIQHYWSHKKKPLIKCSSFWAIYFKYFFGRKPRGLFK